MDWKKEIVCSRQNRTVVEVCKLSERKARDAQKSFRFDGIKLFEEAVKNHLELQTVLLRQSETERLESVLKQRCGERVFEGVGRILLVADGLFDKISEEKSPEGIISVAKYIDKFQKNVTIYNSGDFLRMENERIVLLESVRDPSNIGAVIRSAAAMGVDRLIISSDCADIYHPKAVRASMGTLFNQRIDRVTDLAAAIRGLAENGRRVFAAALDTRAMPLGGFPIRKGDCVVIGNEGHGLSSETVRACTHSVIIPMTGRAESLNAAVAASVLMWEFCKNNI